MMRGFFNRSAGQVSKWAQPLDAEAYSLFREKLLEFSEGMIDPDQCDSKGILKLKNVEINLASLVRTCAHIKVEAWDEEIVRWANVFTASTGFLIPKYPPDIRLLKLQLYPEEYFDGAVTEDEQPISREDLPGILTTLVIDTPESLVAPPKSAMRLWAEHADETFEKLLHDLRQEPPLTVGFTKLADTEDTVAAIFGDEVTAATQALVIEDIYPQLIGNYGALVSVPNRNTIVVKRLEAIPDRELTKNFRELVHHMAAGQAGLISEKVFHFQQGKFKLL